MKELYSEEIQKEIFGEVVDDDLLDRIHSKVRDLKKEFIKYIKKETGDKKVKRSDLLPHLHDFLYEKGISVDDEDEDTLDYLIDTVILEAHVFDEAHKFQYVHPTSKEWSARHKELFSDTNVLAILTFLDKKLVELDNYLKKMGPKVKEKAGKYMGPGMRKHFIENVNRILKENL